MPPATLVLVIDDDASTFMLVSKICQAAGVVAEQTTDAGALMLLVKTMQPAAVVASRSIAGREDGLGWIAELRVALPNVLIAVICNTRDLTVMDAGADLILTRPL